MPRTRIKICGLTQAEDVDAAVNAGADALGFVFYPQSKRAVTFEEAAVLLERLPSFVCSVGLFVNAEQDYVRQAVEKLPLSLLQFHGDEDAAYCASFGLPYIKAVRLAVSGADEQAGRKSRQSLLDTVQGHTRAVGILLDACDPHEAGGTGQQFDWTLVPGDIDKPLILAGGLNTQNVHDAIRQLKPYAVDVSSGVEQSPGVKDAKKIQDFIGSVLSA